MKIPVRDKLGMSEEQFCRLLHIDVRTLKRWEAFGAAPRGPALQVCAGLEEAIARHPGEAIPRMVRTCSAVGGVSYLIVKLLGHWLATRPK